MDFDSLLKKISPILKRIVYKLNTAAYFGNSEDLFQEAMLHLWQAFESGKLADKTESYILQGCYFHLKNYIRIHRGRVNVASLDAVINENEQTLDDVMVLVDDASEDIRGIIDTRLLASTIMNNGLTDREKYMLSFCLEGLTTRQIGLKLGVSHVSVVKMLRRVEKKCVKYLDTK